MIWKNGPNFRYTISIILTCYKALCLEAKFCDKEVSKLVVHHNQQGPIAGTYLPIPVMKVNDKLSHTTIGQYHIYKFKSQRTLWVKEHYEMKWFLTKIFQEKMLYEISVDGGM